MMVVEVGSEGVVICNRQLFRARRTAGGWTLTEGRNGVFCDCHHDLKRAGEKERRHVEYVCVHSLQTKKKRRGEETHFVTTTVRVCVCARAPSLARRSFVLNEQTQENERCSASRLSLNYTVCSFVLCPPLRFSPLSRARAYSLFSPYKATENGTVLSFLICFFFPLLCFNYTRVIRHGGRQPISIGSCPSR